MKNGFDLWDWAGEASPIPQIKLNILLVFYETEH
jgi:hypothetical protein